MGSDKGKGREGGSLSHLLHVSQRSEVRDPVSLSRFLLLKSPRAENPVAELQLFPKDGETIKHLHHGAPRRRGFLIHQQASG